MVNLFEAYRKMILIRTAQQELVDFYLKQKIMCMVHFCIGQEAVAVGVCDSLQTEDKVLSNHRSHGHYLAKGGDLKRLVCELLGKGNGAAKGKGGSMHMIDKTVNFIGSTSILGSVAPLACGVSFEQKYNNKNNITVAFIGDGAFEEGIVYETLNLAALFRTPFLLVVENNFFAINSKLEDRRSENYNAEKIVSGLGVKYLKADGNDYQDVFKKAKILVDEIRENKTPAVLECITYRHMAHSTPLFDEDYRGEDVLETRLEKDSVKKLRQTLLKSGVSEEELANVENVTRNIVIESIQFAVESKYPKKENLYKDVYV